MNAASKWRPAWAILASYAPVSARLHLALFYFYGVYYHWAKRATGNLHAMFPFCDSVQETISASDAVRALCDLEKLRMLEDQNL